jgi:adenosylmethionine-8-amino-7-oxononanoate aminotransferase
MVGVELVADRHTRAPFPRTARGTEAVVAAARERGVLLYSGTGNADGTDGDTLLLGPPFVVTDEELDRIADVTAEAIEVGAGAAQRTSTPA